MCNDPVYLVIIRRFDFMCKILPPNLLSSFSRCTERGDSKVCFLGQGEDAKRYWLNLRCDFEDAGFKPDEFCIKVPCRKCLGCLLDRKKSWTSRVMNEVSQYRNNAFVTLTYDSEHVPPTLVRKHFQNFAKRLRECCRYSGRPIPRFFYRGEYGINFGRPHFHAIIFNYKPDIEKVLFWKTRRGKKVYHYVDGAIPYYSSRELGRLWRFGFNIVAPVCLESVKYVANYLDKGFRTITSDGVVHLPPFNGYSSRPAIGRTWLLSRIDQANGDVEKLFSLYSSGVPYYVRLMRELYPEDFIASFDERRSSVARGSRKPWELTTLTEHEYLQQREERMQAALVRFGRKNNIDSS